MKVDEPKSHHQPIGPSLVPGAVSFFHVAYQSFVSKGFRWIPAEICGVQIPKRNVISTQRYLNSIVIVISIAIAIAISTSYATPAIPSLTQCCSIPPYRLPFLVRLSRFLALLPGMADAGAHGAFQRSSPMSGDTCAKPGRSIGSFLSSLHGRSPVKIRLNRIV